MNVRHLLKRSFFALAAVLAAACSDDDCGLSHIDKLQGLPAVHAGSYPEGDLTLAVGQEMTLAPQLTNGEARFQWYFNGKEVSTDPSYTIRAERPMRAKVQLELSNAQGTVTLENKVLVPGADFSDGFLILNEGWYGHETGNVSYYDRSSNTLSHYAVQWQNFGEQLGNTSQSATLWQGLLYIVSKQQRQLVAVDPRTLEIVRNYGTLNSGRQFYEFVGLNERYGLLTGNAYLTRVDLQTGEAREITMLDVSPDNLYGGTGSAVVLGDNVLVNCAGSSWGSVKGDQLYVLKVEDLLGDLSQYDYKNKFPARKIDVRTNGGVRFVTCDDGAVYTVETTSDAKNNLVRIAPDLTVTRKAITHPYAPSDFGSYREAMFCGTSKGVFYYVADGRIYRATFDDPSPAEPLTDYAPGDDYAFYGAAIRVDEAHNELVATWNTPYVDEYYHNKVARFDATTGELIAEAAYDGYFFPATILFN